MTTSASHPICRCSRVFQSKNKAPPKRPLDTDHRHVLVFTTTAEKKRKNAEKHSLDIKHQIAQRLRESRPESLVVHVPVSCSEVQDSMHCTMYM